MNKVVMVVNQSSDFMSVLTMAIGLLLLRR